MDKYYLILIICLIFVLAVSLIPDFYIIYRLHRKHDKIENLAQEIHIAREKSVENNHEIRDLQIELEDLKND